MKKFFSLTITLLLLLTLFSVSSFGDGEGVWVETDVDNLWQKRAEDSSIEGGSGVWESSEYAIPFIDGSNDLTPLLFIKDLGLSFEWFFPDPYHWEDGPYWISEKDAQFAFPIVGVYKGGYVYSEELQQVLEQYCYNPPSPRSADSLYLPLLRGCIEAFGITQEELKAACVMSRENPETVREALPFLSDEDFNELKDAGRFSSEIDTHPYLMDALYLPDEQDVRSLLMNQFVVNVNGITVRVTDFLEDYDYYEIVTDEWLEQQDLNTPGFRLFLENAKLVYEEELARFPNDPAYPADTPERLAHFEELANRPPKTGEHTALYAVIALTALVPLAAMSICAAKKRRRAI